MTTLRAVLGGLGIAGLVLCGNASAAPLGKGSSMIGKGQQLGKGSFGKGSGNNGQLPVVIMPAGGKGAGKGTLGKSNGTLGKGQQLGKGFGGQQRQ
ncbi:MAG: hypothetical protein H6707_01455 [Deltaproteobacteria bacterium]|nr:hypothetical protein [Deltaproteobacteria bacterium]